MTVLTDKKILDYVRMNKLSIVPFDEDALTPNGYDLELENWSIPAKGSTTAMSIAKIKLPEDVIAIPMLRTTYIFKGLILSSGIIDAGFSGRLKMYIFNSSDNAVVPEKGELRRPIHLLFMETSGKSLMPYGRRHTEKNNSQ